jgi:NADH:ubiquinone oxidoreductase subunit 2 (subunit N)
MVSAAIAAFFYLRVAVLMYAPSEAEPAGDGAAVTPPARLDSGAQIGWASPDGVSASVSTLNAQLVLDDEPPASTGEETPSIIKVPALSGLAIGLCVAFTVAFGVAPAPLLDFANHASLLFLGH